MSSGEFDLTNGSRVAVVGGGPAGSLFSYFLTQQAELLDLKFDIDIYEPRDFNAPGPRGCNMCAGIVSESLVQMLATEGINLPSVVVQRGIEHYLLYTPNGKTQIKTAEDERRIAAVFRGSGPRDIKGTPYESFDGFLLKQAVDAGATHKREKIKSFAVENGRPTVEGGAGPPDPYDLVAVGAGLSRGTLKMFAEAGLEYEPPETTRSHLREFYLGEERVKEFLGNNVHVFLLNIPRIEFAAIVPKGSYATLCLVGEDIDDAVVQTFLATPQLGECLPDDVAIEGSCKCSPATYLRAANKPYANRLVFIGDSGSTRLFKDGIGAAYRTAKAAATTAVLHGVSAESFGQHYDRICRMIEGDNRIGRIVFAVNREIQKRPYSLGGLVRTVNGEQARPGKDARMSRVVWDTFTGSAPYKDIFKRTLHPAFVTRYSANIMRELWPWKRSPKGV